MGRHVSDDGVLDLAEGGGSPEERRHVARCGECAERVTRALEGLDLARRADVPEPPALYWESMRRSVGRRIGESARPASRWPWLIPLAAATALLAVLWSGPAHAPAPTPAPGLPAWTALPDEDEDTSLALLEAVLDESGEDLGDASPVRAQVAALSDEESRLLLAELRAARNGGES